MAFVFGWIIFSLGTNAFSQDISYHPNSHWTVKAEPVTKKSSVQFNFFSPQYGYPQRGLEGKADYEEWEAWKTKNRFSYQHKLDGHIWQAVITNNREEFQKHPEFLALVNGKRPGYGKTSKLCVSNKAVQEIFIRDRLKAFEKLNDPDGSVSVEPSDGAGFCECVNCKKLGSISNQVFFLANLTAKRIRDKFPQGKVNLYAYNRHAEIPDFDIEPNVHVTVIPAGFQSFYDGNLMLNLWAKKAKLKTYYEYFTIPQQKGEQPRLYIQEFIERMNMARKLGYQGYWFEAGVNINSSIALVLFNQLWLDNNLTWDIVSERFLRSCFPGSYTPMKRLFERWWHTWLEDAEIPAALYDLDEASQLAKTKDEQERLNDLKAYVHYLVLYAEWNKDNKNTKLLTGLFDYLYQTSSRVVVNTPALYEMFKPRLDKSLVAKYNWRSRQSRKNLSLCLAEKEIDRNFASDKKKYGVHQSGFTFLPMSKGVQTALRKGQPLKTFALVCKKMGDKIRIYSEGEINIKLLRPQDHGNQNDGKLLMSVMDTEGTIYYNDYIFYAKPSVSLKLPAGKIYSISLLQYFSTDIQITGEIVPILETAQLDLVRSNKTGNTAQRAQLKVESLSNYHFLTE